MGFRIDTKRSGYFSELTAEEVKNQLGIKMHKFLPTIDTLYFSVFIGGDGVINDNGVIGNECKINKILNLCEAIRQTKDETRQKLEPIPFSHGLTATLKSHGNYTLCLTEADLFDIFFTPVIPNAETPRIVIQLRSIGLWTVGADALLLQAYEKTAELLAQHDLEIVQTRENRIDYCYHTNEIASPNKLFTEKDGNILKNVHTNLKKYNLWGELGKQTDEGIELDKSYIRLGSLKGKCVLARVYDKVREVIEGGYKCFFFKLWQENGLISLYDLFCMEYAYNYKNVNYLYHARLEYYIQYGKDPQRKALFEEKLSDKNATIAQIKSLADSYMPKISAIVNIEYQTMRKFYYYSDMHTEHFPVNLEHADIPEPLKKIYKIIDNRQLFLAYLTEKTLSFKQKIECGLEYTAFWQRLRNTPINGKKLGEKVLRDYSFELNVTAVQRRAINAVASNAVYHDKVDTDFVEDISDFLACLNDNRAYEMELIIRKNGKPTNTIDAVLLRQYALKKAKAEMRLKNRKKRRDEDTPGGEENG